MQILDIYHHLSCPPCLPSLLRMRLKTQAIFLCVIFFIFFISFKILEPELENHPHGRDTRADSDYDLKENDKLPVNPKLSKIIPEPGKLEKKLDDEIDARVKNFLKLYDLKWNMTVPRDVWKVAADWVNERQIHPEYTPEMGAMLRKLSTDRIVGAGLGYRGTQLKMSLTLEGGQRAVFKPKWYERDEVVEGKPYDGPDRHNGEIAAFHLNRMLGLRRSPLVAGRVVDLETEIKPVADQKLLDTFYYKDGNTCFYGKCYYCKGPETGVCAQHTQLEGAVVLWLPHGWKFKNQRHPWQRTYRNDLKAKWETDDRYCDKVAQTPPYDAGPRLMDIIDSSVFDYLIGNADRHHYETFEGLADSMLVMVDSAKSFGNPAVDERTILAPLYQCCKIRKSLWERLKLFQDGVLSRVLREILSHDAIAPLLAEPYYAAMDRRLTFIMGMVDFCVRKRGSKVFVVDKYSYDGS